MYQAYRRRAAVAPRYSPWHWASLRIWSYHSMLRGHWSSGAFSASSMNWDQGRTPVQLYTVETAVPRSVVGASPLTAMARRAPPPPWAVPPRHPPPPPACSACAPARHARAPPTAGWRHPDPVRRPALWTPRSPASPSLLGLGSLG